MGRGSLAIDRLAIKLLIAATAVDARGGLFLPVVRGEAPVLSGAAFGFLLVARFFCLDVFVLLAIGALRFVVFSFSTCFFKLLMAAINLHFHSIERSLFLACVAFEPLWRLCLGRLLRDGHELPFIQARCTYCNIL